MFRRPRYTCMGRTRFGSEPLMLPILVCAQVSEVRDISAVRQRWCSLIPRCRCFIPHGGVAEYRLLSNPRLIDPNTLNSRTVP